MELAAHSPTRKPLSALSALSALTTAADNADKADGSSQRPLGMRAEPTVRPLVFDATRSAGAARNESVASGHGGWTLLGTLPTGIPGARWNRKLEISHSSGMPFSLQSYVRPPSLESERQDSVNAVHVDSPSFPGTEQESLSLFGNRGLVERGTKLRVSEFVNQSTETE